MPPIDRYGSTRPDRTPLFVGLGLLLLALVGWTVWAMSSRDTADYAAVTTVTTPGEERDVALEAQRRTVTETRNETTRPMTIPGEVVEQPPTTGPNGVVSVDPVAPAGSTATVAEEERQADEVSLDTPAVPGGTEDGAVEDGADLEAFVTDVRGDLTALRREMTEFQTRPGTDLEPAQQEQLRALETRLHDLEQRVNSLQSAGAAEMEPLEEEIRTALMDLEEDFDDLTGGEVGSQ